MAASLATTETGVANLALIRLGESGELSDLDSDTTRNAKAARPAFAHARDEVFRTFKWKCLIARADLSVNVGTNNSQYTVMYDLPADYIRALDLEGKPAIQYSIEGSLLYSDEESMNLRYLKQDATVANWDAILIDCVALSLACKICYRITQSEVREQYLYRQYTQQLGAAVRAGLVEDPDDAAEALLLLEGTAPPKLRNRNRRKETV